MVSADVESVGAWLCALHRGLRVPVRVPESLMPLSADPMKQARQLANLKRGGAPSAPAGNRRAVTHGAYANVLTDRLDAKVAEVFAALAADAPVKDTDGMLPAADGAMVRLLAAALCRLDDIGDYLRDRGLRDGKQRLRVNELDLERRIRAEAADYAAAMGMQPRARAALGLDLARAQRTTLADFIDGTAEVAS